MIYYRLACSIPLDNELVLTGGAYTMKTVSKYDNDGWVEDMPSLKRGRHSHGCTAFVSGGEQVKLDNNNMMIEH